MRLLKRRNGSFYIDDAPMKLTGKAARAFLEAMAESDRNGNTLEKQAFLEECAAIYRRSMTGRKDGQ